MGINGKIPKIWNNGTYKMADCIVRQVKILEIGGLINPVLRNV